MSANQESVQVNSVNLEEANIPTRHEPNQPNAELIDTVTQDALHVINHTNFTNLHNRMSEEVLMSREPPRQSQTVTLSISESNQDPNQVDNSLTITLERTAATSSTNSNIATASTSTIASVNSATVALPTVAPTSSETVAVETFDMTTDTDSEEDNDVSLDDFRFKPHPSVAPVVRGVEPVPANQTESDEEAECCPICFEPWTNSGDHRLVCLRCGHLFGQSCLLKWLKDSQTQKCPQCNATARRKDIRVLFAKTIRCIDTTERDRARQELDKEKDARRKAEVEAAAARYHHQLAVAECKQLREQLAQQLAQQRQQAQQSSSSCAAEGKREFSFDQTIKISEDGGCRTLAYCPRMATLCVSQTSPRVSLWQGCGIKKLNMLDLKMCEYVHIHSQAIRDLTFGRDGTLLSCSMDKTLRLTSLHSNRVIQTYTCRTPVWSCAWSADDAHCVYAGLQGGVVGVYDTRQLTEHVTLLNEEGGSKSPVISLQYVPRGTGAGAGSLMYRCAGVLMAQMDKTVFFERKASSDTTYTPHVLSMGGSMTSVHYEDSTGHMLTSFRPSVRHNRVRHQVSELSIQSEIAQDSSLSIRPSCNELHTFYAGSTQNLLSRSKLLLLPKELGQSSTNLRDLGQPSTNQLLACAGDESSSSVHIWDAGQGSLFQKLTSTNPVVDLCGVPVNDRTFLAALTDKNLTLYSWK